jgi:hypothetical protein
VTGADLERLFYRNIPREYVRKAFQAVYLAHQVAHDECYSGFAATEARNVLGYVRRGKLEGYLRDSAEPFPGLLANVLQADGSNWNHTEICGGPVVLTENAVQTPCALVEKAGFRRGLAQSNQLSLLGDAVPHDAPLYALLLHSRFRSLDPDEQKKYGYLPGSAYIAFPARDLDSYLHAVNLVVEFPDIVSAHMPEEWDTEAHLRYIRQARRMAT